MPATSTLPTKNVVLRFPTGSTHAGPSRQKTGLFGGAGRSRDDDGDESEAVEETYQLLELPPAILKQVEACKPGESYPLTIKGKPSDEAVLCTPDSTFLLRTVDISNSLLICRAPPDGQDDAETTRPTLEIRDIAHHILEPIPQAANLERLRTILKASAWQGMGEDSLGRSSDDEEDGQRPRKRARSSANHDSRKKVKRYTREQLESVIQASAAELNKGLKERNIVEVDGRMLLLPATKLYPLLSIILTLLTIHTPQTSYSDPSSATAPSGPIIRSLEEDHDVRPGLAEAVLNLFGSVDDDSGPRTWHADVQGMVREVGRGLLEGLGASLRSGSEGADGKAFLRDWRAAVGETWEELADMKLLEGNYLLVEPTAAARWSSAPLLKPFFVHQLPLHAPTRFAELFLVRPRWRPEEMSPFLKGLIREGDAKERDKLVAKFVRVVKEPGDGVWWYPRRTG